MKRDGFGARAILAAFAGLAGRGFAAARAGAGLGFGFAAVAAVAAVADRGAADFAAVRGAGWAAGSGLGAGSVVGAGSGVFSATGAAPAGAQRPARRPSTSGASSRDTARRYIRAGGRADTIFRSFTERAPGRVGCAPWPSA